MRLSAARKITVLLVSLFLMGLATDSISTAQARLPQPVLVFLGSEEVVIRGKQLKRYNYMVDNRAAYPNELFASAPTLPPCGTNTKASRTWVDIYQQNGKPLNAFCALGKNDDLNGIWFVMEPDVVPPSWVYLELNDRQTNTKYKSNLAETTL